jgi:hypothetical protein
MPTPMTVPVLLADFARRGFTLRAVSGRLSVSPATALTAADRTVIRERRTELLAALSPVEPWDTAAAIRLMFEADALVEQLGVDGRFLVIANAASKVVNVLATHDMAAFRVALSEFAVIVRATADERLFVSGTGQTLGNTGSNALTAVGHG